MKGLRTFERTFICSTARYARGTAPRKTRRTCRAAVFAAVFAAGAPPFRRQGVAAVLEACATLFSRRETMEPDAIEAEDPRARARAQFAELVGGDAQPPLVEAALAIALEEYPDLPVRNYLARLHAFTSVLADRVRHAADAHPGTPVSVAERIEILNRYVFDELGFRGNRDEFYDPRNSFLNDVLDRRLGIPITLSVVYMELAKGAGLRLAGVGFPGHFLVKTQGVYPARVLDPFNGGAELDRTSLMERLRESGQEQAQALNALRAVDNRSIVTRMLLNLKEVYLRGGEDARALGVVERLLLLLPQAGEEWAIRGALCGRVGRYDQGIEALEHALTLLTEAADRERVEAELRRLRYWKSRLN
jgi:regulator of sirC expression with transglutaminase-like and TPR domain